MTPAPVPPPLARAAGRVSAGADRRRRTARLRTAAILLLAGVLGMLGLMGGEAWLGVGQVVAALLGTDDPSYGFLVRELRLPRAITALVAGACLGLAGHVFQSVLRNPLASPDIVGITAGASAGAAVMMIGIGQGGAAVSAAAIAGGIATAAAIMLLSRRHGSVSPSRAVLVGIGLGALLTAVVGYLMTRADVDEAQALLLWMTGSISGITWASAGPLTMAAAVLVPAVLALRRAMEVLRLGDDAARALGARVERERAVLLLLAVLLASVATAAAGPIAFVAFVSAPIARRVTGSGQSAGASAAMGAALTAAADLAAQHALPVGVPVGVMTAGVGAPYLLYLLTRGGRA